MLPALKQTENRAFWATLKFSRLNRTHQYYHMSTVSKANIYTFIMLQTSNPWCDMWLQIRASPAGLCSGLRHQSVNCLKVKKHHLRTVFSRLHNFKVGWWIFFPLCYQNKTENKLNKSANGQLTQLLSLYPHKRQYITPAFCLMSSRGQLLW